MSNLILPVHVAKAVEKKKKQEEKKEKELESAKLPDPTGWRLLVLPHKGKGKTKGGAFWTRAKNYNAKYYTDGYQFAVRNVEGIVTFFGRYTPELKMQKES